MDGHIIIGTEIDTKDFDSQITYIEKQMEEIEHKLKQADMGFEVGDTIKLEAQYEKLSNRLSELIRKKEDLNKTDFSNIENSINNIGNSVTNVTKKVGKWALAVFGIRSAYMFVRQAMSTLSQYNDQIATDVEYIRYLLATTLQPVIETLIKLVYKLLAYINFIAKAWFGVDLFANASADAFNKNKKALAGANKQAKELQKTIAGFDEMNVLNENVVGETTSKETSVVPTIDLSKMEDVKIPGWIEWIAQNKDLIISALLAIAAAFVTLQLGFGGWVALIVAGIVAIVALIIQNWGKIKEVLGKVGSWIYDNIIKPVGDFFKGLWDGIVDGFNTSINWIKNTFTNVVNFFKNIINTIVNLFKTIGTKVGDAVGSAFKAVINGVLTAIENILNTPINTINGLIETINIIPGVNLGKLPTFKLPRLAKGGILNMPGKGVDYYGANLAEKGREAVLPLTDSQQMELLGASIGKYITVAPTIPVYVGNRMVAREIRRINGEDDFAYNR